MTATDETRPLPDDQVELARAVGRQMRRSLQRLMNCFPPDSRSAGAIAEELGVEGVVARRLVRAANESGDELRVLTRLPSVENLRKVQRAAITDDLTPTITADLLSAVDAFEALGKSVGGGKANLTRRLRATLGEQPADAESDEG